MFFYQFNFKDKTADDDMGRSGSLWDVEELLRLSRMSSRTRYLIILVCACTCVR